MFTSNHQVSLVTAVLPKTSAGDTLKALVEDEHANALVSQARGSMLRDRWWKSWVPPIRPAKSMLQLLVPDEDLDRILGLIVEHGNLHLQASGAVFSQSAESVHIGTDCHLISPDRIGQSTTAAHAMKSDLHAIFCVVSNAASDRVAKAAINAGAHGPVVYYAEGHGLRDRLGWLRFTKDQHQEVLMIVTDENDVDVIFDAIAKAAELHLPGRGFMYRLVLNKGMFNLPSRLSNHHFDANMQQIIHAIDHLAGHTHWRDQSVFNVGGQGKGAGLKTLSKTNAVSRDQVCLTIAVDRDHTKTATDLLLGSGAQGLSLSYSKLLTHESEQHLAQAHVNREYAIMHCVTNRLVSAKIATEIESQATTLGLNDFCALQQQVPATAHYQPSNIDYRQERGGNRVETVAALESTG